MKKFRFSIPNKKSPVFRCEVFEGSVFLYSRELHIYDNSFSDEMNTTFITKRLSDIFHISEKELEVPVRMAILLDESEWSDC